MLAGSSIRTGAQSINVLIVAFDMLEVNNIDTGVRENDIILVFLFSTWNTFSEKIHTPI